MLLFRSARALATKCGILVSLTLFLTACAYTAKYGGPFDREEQDGVATLEALNIGNSKQWVLIRGRSRHNPVFLLIHGGPGGAEMSAVRHYLGALEDDFVVVTYDMRGAGKSQSELASGKDLSLSVLVSDAEEIIRRVRSRFGDRPIYLAANSWGTIVGTLVAQKHPDWLAAYIGIAQWTDGVDRERASYRLVLDWARRTGNADAVRDLERIGPPPFSGPGALENVGVQKSWLLKCGGMIRGSDNIGLLLTPLFLASEYTIAEKLRFMDGFAASMERLWPESMNVNLLERVPELAVPVYFVAGRHDWNIPLTEVQKYFDLLRAPRKQLVVFENSAHVPHYEEAGQFVRFMRETVLAGQAGSR